MFPQCLLRLCSGHNFRLISTLISTEVILFWAQYELETFLCNLIFVFCMLLATVEFSVVCNIYLFTVSEVDAFFAPHIVQILYIVYELVFNSLGRKLNIICI